MIEEQLINYGILGLWTITLIVERYRWQKDMTRAINKLSDVIERKL